MGITERKDTPRENENYTLLFIWNEPKEALTFGLDFKLHGMEDKEKETRPPQTTDANVCQKWSELGKGVL
jgi:hypothetical protein